MLKKSPNSVLASLRPSKYQMKLSEVGIAVGAFPFAKIHSRGERPTRTLRNVPPRPVTRCGFASGMARLGAPGLGG